MENWLNAFARGLRVEVEDGDSTSSHPASEEQKEAFLEALKADLEAQGRVKYLRDTVTYDYRMGKIRGRSRHHGESHVSSPNATFANVLRKLPKLPKGESYTLPVPTFITFVVVDKRDGETIYDVASVCSWIMQNM